LRTVDALTLTVNGRISGGAMTYAFIGEYHASGIDVARRNKAVAQFAVEGRAGIVLERGLRDQYAELRSALAGRDNTVIETSELGSSDDGRNSEIATAISESLVGDVAAPRIKTVLIFFGQDHEEKIRGYVEQAYSGKSATAEWLSFRSITETVENLPDPAYVNAHLYRSAGFVRPPTRTIQDHEKLLLTKGVWLKPFAMEIKQKSGDGSWMEVLLKADDEAWDQSGEEISKKRNWYLDVWGRDVARLRLVT
jgi:hypothetical protein